MAELVRTSSGMVSPQMEAQRVRADDADPAGEPGAALLEAMTAEIDELYRDREGSIHEISASSSELSPPSGAFLVLRDGAQAVGCGGLKRLDAETCELKRMYLRPDARGRGLSRVLLGALEERARQLGYRRARLDTGDRQPAARRLYETAGYGRIPDYNGNTLARLWFEREL